MDAETDDAFRARFRNFIASRSRATLLAIGYAISSVQQGLSYTIAENVDATGAPLVGNFVATVDDGSGTPSSALLATVSVAVDAVRPVGSSFLVRAPTVVNVPISFLVSVSPGAVKSQIVAIVGAAVASFVNALPIGAPLPVTRIAQVAYGAHPSVTNVTNLLVNGGPSDVVASLSTVIKTSSVAVS